MTRFKKECIKRGFDHEEKYPCLPYTFKNGISIEAINYNAETCEILSVYNVMVCRYKVNRDFTLMEVQSNDY